MRTLIFFMLLFASAVVTLAQTPQYALSGGTSNNTIPLMSTTNRVQWVYNRTDFAGLPSGSQLITRLYLRSGSNVASATFANFTIRIGHTTLSTFPNGTFVTGLTTVFSATTHNITSVTAGNWVAFNLQTPFTYNGTQNLIVEVSQTAYAGGFTVRQNTAGGNRRIFGTVASTTGSASTGIADMGIDVYPIFPCTKSLPLPATNVNSNAALLRWAPVTGAVSYDYMVSTSASWPLSGWSNTTATSTFMSGLTPSTRYFLLVRARCSATTYSFWDTISFVTLPPCSTPVGFKVSRLDSNTADIQWRKVPTALRYQYLIDKTRATPSTSELVLAINTTDTFAKFTGLSDATKYFLHIRSFCAGNDSSAWSVDSFTTPRSCKATAMVVEILDNNAALIHWDTIQTAVSYEYYMSLTPDLPKFGTPLTTNFKQFTTLQPATMYYLHNRNSCMDAGVSAYSPWSTLAFSTTSLNVSTVSVAQQRLYFVYPNPAQNTLHIEAPNYKSGITRFEFTDITGRIVLEGALEAGKSKFDISNIRSGTYLLKIYGSDNTELHKIVKE